MNKYTVSTTTYPRTRQWNIRIEYVGLGYIISLQINTAPALRIIIFGWSIHLGKIPNPPQTIVYSPTINQSGYWGGTPEDNFKYDKK